MPVKPERSFVVWLIAVVAVVFGLLTIKAGGVVIFIDGADRQAAGNYVPFVLWFNFLAGFVYIIAGTGLWLQKRWAVKLSVLIAVATVIIYALFGLHIFGGGLYEKRTIIAMSLRSVVWAVIAILAHRQIRV